MVGIIIIILGGMAIHALSYREADLYNRGFYSIFALFFFMAATFVAYQNGMYAIAIRPPMSDTDLISLGERTYSILHRQTVDGKEFNLIRSGYGELLLVEAKYHLPDEFAVIMYSGNKLRLRPIENGNILIEKPADAVPQSASSVPAETIETTPAANPPTADSTSAGSASGPMF